MTSANILINHRVLFDGGMGTQIAARGLDTSCPELNLVNAFDDVVRIHMDYIGTGSTVITTDTFGANAIKLRRMGLQSRAVEFMTTGVRAARRAVELCGGNARVAADIGPTGELLAPFGELTYDEAYAAFRAQADAARAAGADLAIIETMSSLLEGKLAALACRDAGLPFILSYTFEGGVRTLMGDTPAACAVTAESLGALAIATNCSGGPEQMLETVRQYRAYTSLPILAQPNAGLPELVDGAVRYPYTPELMTAPMQALLDAGADAAGGCCGTGPEHIRAIAGLEIAPVKAHASVGAMIASSREVAALDGLAADSLTRMPLSEAEDYDDEEPQIVDIDGESPGDAYEMLESLTTMVHVPLFFTGGDAELRAQLMRRCNGCPGEFVDGALLPWRG